MKALKDAAVRSSGWPGLGLEPVDAARSGDPPTREHLRVVSEILMTTLSGDAVWWMWIDLAVGAAGVVAYPDGTPDHRGTGPPIFALLDCHPLIRSDLADAAGRRQGPRRLSDVERPGDLRRNLAFRQLLAPSGVQHQLGIMGTRCSAQSGTWWVVNRFSRDFTDGEVRVAAQLQPVLALLDGVLGPESGASEGRPDLPRGQLTPREVEVLRLVSTGRTAAAIARTMGISERTVAKHLENAYRKLGCHDRLLAVRRAEELRLIPRRADGVGRAR